MPVKEYILKRKYYKILEVGEMLGVSTSLLRYWEASIRLIHPKKNRNGNRYYIEQDIEDLKIVYFLLKELGLTIKGANKFIFNKKDFINQLKKTNI